MKTIKWLKASIVLQSIFVFSCFASSLCFAINSFFGLDIFFSLGIVLIYGWIVNPIVLVSIVGLIISISERGVGENRKIIGKKWIWFILFFVIDILLYLTAGMMMVEFTGGV